MKSNLLLLLKITFLLFVSQIAKGQDLLDELYFEESKKTQLTESTFQMLRIGLAHSVETRKKGVLELSSYTRYWNVPEIEGVPREQNNFGSDRISARFGFDYALTDRFSTGLGWSNNSVFDGYFKYRLIRQKTGAKKTPFSVTVLAAGSFRGKDIGNIPLDSNSISIYNPSVQKTSINLNDSFTDKTTLISQLLIARKVTHALSIQVSPTLIYRGSRTFSKDPQAQLAVGLGGRYKLGKHVSIASEYFYTPKTYALESIETFGPFSLGVNWEVSKVQIQMFLTNTGNFSEDLTITETPVNFNTKDGNLFFGWNFSYVLHVKQKNKRK